MPIAQTSLAVSPSSAVVTVGDYATYTVLIAFPEGTTIAPTVHLRLPLAATAFTTGPLNLFNVSVDTPSSFGSPPFKTSIVDTDSDGLADLAIVSTPVVINQPDGVRDSRDQIAVNVVTLVLPSAAGISGSLWVTSEFTHQNGTAIITEVQRAVNVSIAQPILSWNVAFNSTSGGSGSVVRCTITLSHAGTSTAAAEEVNILAKLQPYFTLVAGSIESVYPSIVLAPSSSTEGWDGVALIKQLPKGSTAVINFNAVVTNDVPAASVVSNTLVANYSSAKVNGFSSSLTTVSTYAILPVPISQFVLNNSSLAETGGNNVTIGEHAKFQVTLTLPKGTTISPSVTVTAPTPYGRVHMVSASVVALPSNIIASDISSATSDVDADGIKDIATISFSSIVVQPGASSTVVLEIVGLVYPNSLNTAGKQLNFTSVFAYKNATTTLSESQKTVTLTIVQPILTWTANWNATVVDAGDVLKCSLFIQHAPASTGVAYNINVTGNLLPGFLLNLLPTSFNSSDASAIFNTYASADSHGQDWIVMLPSLLPGRTANISFLVTVNSSVRANANVRNNLVAQYLSAPQSGSVLYLYN